MNAFPGAEGGAETARSARFHPLRRLKDLAAGRLIALGGIAVIPAVTLILFYLAWVVFPLFLPADAAIRDLGQREDWARFAIVYSALEEQQRIGLRVNTSSTAEFFELDGLQAVSDHRLFGDGASLAAARDAVQRNGVFAVASTTGDVLLVRHGYRTDYEGGVENRRIIPSLDFPYGELPRKFEVTGSIKALALSDEDSSLVVAIADGDSIGIEWNAKQENFLTGEVTLQGSQLRARTGFTTTGLVVSGDNRWLHAADTRGRIHHFTLPGLELARDVRISDVALTELQPLLGGISILAGDASGRITQLFPVRDDQNQYHLRVIRSFSEQSAAIVKIIPESRRKGFLVLDEDGNLGIYHSTAGQLVLNQRLESGLPAHAALSPRADGLLLFGDDGSVQLLEIENEHPEVSVSSIWR